MGILVCLLMNFIAGASSFLLNYKIFKFRGFIDSLLSLFVIYSSQVIITEVFLGTLGKLSLQNVIIFDGALFLIVLFLTRSKEYQFNYPGLKNILIQVSLNKVAALITSVILGFGLIKLFINLVNPPFGWDNLNYHFTFPVEWLKHQNLENPITISDDPSPTYYPINGSLFFLWFILPLRNVFLADLGQLPFFILAFLATYGLSRKVALSKHAAFYAAGLFILIPNVFKHMKMAYVDMMVAGLFLCSLNFLFLTSKEFSVKNIVIYSMSLGLLLGTKTVALPYFLILLLPFLYYCFKNIKKPQLFIFSACIIAALGGFTYIRNFLETGNPLYPLDFKILGRSLFRGVMDSATYSAHFRPQDYGLAKLLFHEGLGAQTLIFILPGLFLGLPLMLMKKKKGLDFMSVYFLILPFLIYLAYRYIIPLPNSRYLYALLGAGIITGFLVFEALKAPLGLIKSLVLISVLASISELAKRQELIFSIALTTVLFFTLPYFIKYFQGASLIKKKVFITASLIFLILSLIMAEKDYARNEYPRYIRMVKYSGFWPDAARAWEWLNSNTAGNNIAYIGRPVPFPLYGTGFKNNVYYVSVNKTEPAKLHYFLGSHYRWGYDFLSQHKEFEEKRNYRFEGDYPIWLDNLLKRKTDYLFVYSLHQTKEIIFPVEDSWAKANPLKFEPAFSNATVHIYRISR